MNLIGHMVCAEHLGRDAALGSMLPDLLSLYDRKIRPMRLIRSADAEGAPARGAGTPERAVMDGMRFHFHVDSAFHRSDLFRDGADLIRTRLVAASETPGLKRFAVAHLLTELFLDHLLVVETPGRLGDFYGALERGRGESTRTVLAGLEGMPWGPFTSFLRRLEGIRFADGYVEQEDLLLRVDRILGRLGQRRLEPPERTAALEAMESHAVQAAGQLAAFVAAMRAWQAPVPGGPGAVDSRGLAGIE